MFSERGRRRLAPGGWLVGMRERKLTIHALLWLINTDVYPRTAVAIGTGPPGRWARRPSPFGGTNGGGGRYYGLRLVPDIRTRHGPSGVRQNTPMANGFVCFGTTFVLATATRLHGNAAALATAGPGSNK